MNDHFEVPSPSFCPKGLPADFTPGAAARAAGHAAAADERHPGRAPRCSRGTPRGGSAGQFNRSCWRQFHIGVVMVSTE